MTNVKNKNALITGASSGIGWEISNRLAELGCNLVIVARNKQKLEQLKEEITRKHEVKVHVITQDFALEEAASELREKIKHLGMQIDVLINNAGYGMHKYFIDTTWLQHKDMLNVLVMNLTHLTELYAKEMVSRNFGFIMLTASTGAFQPTPSYATYAAAKSYVMNFGLALNYELRKSKVSCSVLCPGYTVTGFQKASHQNGETTYMKMTKMTAEQVANIAMKKMLNKKALIIPGFMNICGARLAGLIPKRLGAKISLSALGEPEK